jgi:hypothetical protein
MSIPTIGNMPITAIIAPKTNPPANPARIPLTITLLEDAFARDPPDIVDINDFSLVESYGYCYGYPCH